MSLLRSARREEKRKEKSGKNEGENADADTAVYSCTVSRLGQSSSRCASCSAAAQLRPVSGSAIRDRFSRLSRLATPYEGFLSFLHAPLIASNYSARSRSPNSAALAKRDA